ncbi:MAG: ABC transporter permease subunit [Lachnospirales bacterium]
MNIMTVIFNGLSTSSILLITALGLAITFGLMRVINMAHGEFIMIGVILLMWFKICFQHFCQVVFLMLIT